MSSDGENLATLRERAEGKRTGEAWHDYRATYDGACARRDRARRLNASGAAALVADGMCKMAVEQGWALVLLEQVIDDRPSPWPFVCDTVLTLALTREGSREMRVIKHRFGACQSGPQGFGIDRTGVRVGRDCE